MSILAPEGQMLYMTQFGSVSSTMAFRVEQAREILGPRLAHLWASSRAAHRPVTCVTHIAVSSELDTPQAGEIVVLDASPATEECVLQLLEPGAHSNVAAVLAPIEAIS